MLNKTVHFTEQDSVSLAGNRTTACAFLRKLLGLLIETLYLAVIHAIEYGPPIRS